MWDTVKRIAYNLRHGSERTRMRKAKELEELRKRGLAPEDEAAEAAEEEKKKKEEEKGDDGKAGGDGKKKPKADDKGEKKGKGGAGKRGGAGGAGAEEEAKDADKGPELTPREQELEDLKQRYFVQAEHTVLREHPSVTIRKCALLAAQEEAERNKPVELNGPIGYGPCKIQPESSLRTDYLSKVVDRPWFDNFILACILCSCAILAYEGPGLKAGDPLAEYVAIFDLAFLGIFCIEALLKILYKGFLFTNIACEWLKAPAQPRSPTPPPKKRIVSE